MEGLGADSEEKHEPASDIDIAVVDSLKALDPKRPIREVDIAAITDHPIPACRIVAVTFPPARSASRSRSSTRS